MTELQLYKFLRDNDVEMQWHENELMCYLDAWIIGEFCNLADQTLFDDEHIRCWLKKGYISFDLCYICEHYDIEPENIFSKEEK
jgi:hypothetical protein